MPTRYHEDELRGGNYEAVVPDHLRRDVESKILHQPEPERTVTASMARSLVLEAYAEGRKSRDAEIERLSQALRAIRDRLEVGARNATAEYFQQIAATALLPRNERGEILEQCKDQFCPYDFPHAHLGDELVRLRPL